MERVVFLSLLIIILLGLSFYNLIPPVKNEQLAAAGNAANSVVQNIVYSDAESEFPYHAPYGIGIGVYPGRVVWAHDLSSVKWDGTGYWWKPEHFNEKVVHKMVETSIASLAGADTAAKGWQTIFLRHNAVKGNNNGYQTGQKIAIKVNLNGTSEYSEDKSGKTKTSYTNPVLLKELLTSLVDDADVRPEDITVYDVSRIFPEYMIALCSEGKLKGVHFVGRDNCTADKNSPIVWSQQFKGSDVTSYFPTCVTEAFYIINLANLKGHSWGMTLCAKNNFGSFINDNYVRPPVGASLHPFMTDKKMDAYTPLVDLMANKQLGRKTVLYMLDALICAPSEVADVTGENSKWQQAPFNSNYTASIFMSQDPVAIDSVGADLLMNEPIILRENAAVRHHSEVECYLHEAGLVLNPPSGTVYYDGTGNKVDNLGVHEHWANGKNKTYSRNRGSKNGIELFYVDIDNE